MSLPEAPLHHPFFFFGNRVAISNLYLAAVLRFQDCSIAFHHRCANINGRSFCLSIARSLALALALALSLSLPLFNSLSHSITIYHSLSLSLSHSLSLSLSLSLRALHCFKTKIMISNYQSRFHDQQQLLEINNGLAAAIVSRTMDSHERERTQTLRMSNLLKWRNILLSSNVLKLKA